MMNLLFNTSTKSYILRHEPDISKQIELTV